MQNIDEYLSLLKEGKCLTERDLRMVCEKIKELLMEESNVQPVRAPVTICGDIHGQFYDLLELFRVGGQIPDTNYIFIGDFVDRGYNSVETFEYLMCLKIKYPQNITLLRGNHETRQITQVYGFLDEIVRKYGNQNPWKYCTDEVEVPHDGPFCDLMWSDPEDITTWAINTRGAGWLFGSQVTKEYNYLNGINLIARAHQLVDAGYQFWFPDKNLVTVWSAPNYCYRCGNLAAILKLNEDLEQKFETFEAVTDASKQINPKSLLPYFL
ncbi:ser thr protein phosphatase family protein, putative [Ichthyophthirius multifiliis]|uniref:Serine/threonine-protein phosphatase n=1 Tax=Ichthyophthirius multifiliis TaxID=5932 RepID=G0QTW4_ICHMU|nr:ser thr protein phosphatase family protein, putative [Ichthyophthirius multifiliis]EGR31323.1 ser thr protein phosphatase family protein, putative [Ichthyophthirius multifiliis]|eukprot:XP_004034809.1 ser thr protein phosphatase family protein, putative [Ichthyophthirius multifiliis]